MWSWICCGRLPIPSASLPIPSAQGCELAVGGTCRAAGSRSGAGSLDCIPQTLFPSRALIPGLGPPLAALCANDYFPLIDYPCHCGADILPGSPAWSLIMGAWGMILPSRHPSIAVSNSREGRQTIVGTCSTEVLLFLGQEATAEEEESLEGGRGGPVIADALWGSAAGEKHWLGMVKAGKEKKRGGTGMKWKELRARLRSTQTAWWPLVHEGWRKQTEWLCGPSGWSSSGFQPSW